MMENQTANKTNNLCRLFFIIGTGRSGTTLMGQVMNAHSKICVPHELQIMFEYSQNGERLAEVFESGKNIGYGAKDYIELVRVRCPHNFHLYYDYVSFFKSLEYPQLSLSHLLSTLYCSIANTKGKTIFAEHTPWYGQNIPLIHRLFPNAKFIHMVRDGRDVSISFTRTPWWHDDPLQNLVRWHVEVSKIEKDGEGLPRDQFTTIRYEDLVTDPESTIKKVCAFIEVPFEKAMLRNENHINYFQFSKSYSSDRSSEAYNKWSEQKKDPFFTDSVYAWKKNREVDFQLMEAETSTLLQKLRYEV